MIVNCFEDDDDYNNDDECMHQFCDILKMFQFLIA